MSGDAPRQRRKLAAILMADVSGFSRLMGEDEERTTARMQEFHRRVQTLIESHDGRLVDTAGDSVFGEFDSVVEAVRCACEVQENQAAANAGEPADRRIDTRIGVHLGDVIVEDERVWGDGVNIAARLEQTAEPGGICISEAVHQQIQGKLDLTFQDMGERQLKNIRYPVQLYGIPPPGSVRVASSTRAVSRPRLRVRDASGAPDPETPTGWPAALLHTPVLLMLVVSAGLITSPVYLASTGGALPTLGTVLGGVAVGRAWQRLTGRRSRILIPLGIGVALGALLTNWSGVTNGLFALAGAILISLGVSRGYVEGAADDRG